MSSTPSTSGSPQVLPVPRARSRLARGDALWGFARRVRTAEGRRRLHIVWGRVLAFAAVLAVVAWLGLGVAAWGFVRWRQGVPTVTIWDMLVLPLRWDVYQKKRGDFYIAKAREYFDAGDFGAAFQFLRVGVMKSPANIEGRMRLAQVYAMLARQPEQGIKLLEEGMRYGSDSPDYLETYLALLFANREDERARTMAEARLAEAPAGSRQAQVFALAAAQACFLRARYAEARDFLARGQIERTAEGQILQAQLEWEQGEREPALKRLRAIVNSTHGKERAYELLDEYLREAGRMDEVREVALLRVIAFSRSLPARMALLKVYSDEKDSVRLDKEVEATLAALGHEQRVVLALADFAAASANVALADRVRGMTDAATLPPEIGPLMAIEARLAAADYRAALGEIEMLLREAPPWLEKQGAAIAGLQAVANFGVGRTDLGELYLDKFLDQDAGQAGRLVAVARRLEIAGAVDAARRTLVRAVETDADHQAALTDLVALDLRTDHVGDLPRNIDRLLDMRKPPLSLLRQAYQRLQDTAASAPEQASLLAKLREAIQQRDRTAAL